MRRSAALIVFSLMQRASRADGREKKLSLPGYRLKFPQDGDGARRERDAMRALHLHFLARYRPNARVQIEFRPFRRAKLAGPHKGQGEQFERCPRFRRAIIARDGAKKPAKGFGLDDRGAMVDDGGGKSAL